MNMRTLRVALIGVLTSALLVGCGADQTSPNASPTPSGSAGASPSDDATATTGEEPDGSKKSSSAGSSDPESESSDPTEGSTPGDGGDQANGTSQEDGGAGLEMPKEPEPSVNSLSELLGSVGGAPLVSTPLPRAASAQGRLVSRFPTFLRPARASRVGSSSISPSGNRLQVTLVASTPLAPEDVLLAYRTRLGGRGLGELAAPATAAGSVAAAFRRGRSVVTITATEDGSSTSYSVQATLSAGGA